MHLPSSHGGRLGRAQTGRLKACGEPQSLSEMSFAMIWYYVIIYILLLYYPNTTTVLTELCIYTVTLLHCVRNYVAAFYVSSPSSSLRTFS